MTLYASALVQVLLVSDGKDGLRVCPDTPAARAAFAAVRDKFVFFEGAALGSVVAGYELAEVRANATPP